MHVPSEQETSNPQLFSENVRRNMSRVMNVPTTAHSLEDSMLMLWTVRNKTKIKINVVIEEIRNKFKISNVKELEEVLKSFNEFDLK